MKVQFIKTPGGEELAVLPRAELERLKELADGELDGAAARQVLDRIVRGEEEVVPVEVANRLFGGENPVKVWREHRGFAQAKLAAAAGVSKSFLSQIESGQRGGSAAVLRSLAKALAVDMEDLVAVKTGGA